MSGNRALAFVVTAIAAGGAMAYAGHHHHADPPSRATTTAALSAYVNPLAGGQWQAARTDQGVDYHPVVPEPVRAIGSGVVVYSSTTDCLPSGWPGCAAIGYRLTAGPKKGGIIYVAEHLEHLLPEGARFGPGAALATALPGYPWIETGWANCAGDGPVVHYDGAGDGTPMAGGLAFARFMRELGAGTAQNPGPGPDIVKASC